MKSTTLRLLNKQGFTIVELLIVIVIIAILAAITVVAYNGVTARANASSAQSSAETVLKKAEAYNAEYGAYPILPSALTASAAQSTSYGLNGVTIATGTGGTAPNFTTAPTTIPSSPNTVIWYACTSPSGAGFRASWWEYNATTPAWRNETIGAACTTWTFKSIGATV